MPVTKQTAVRIPLDLYQQLQDSAREHGLKVGPEVVRRLRESLEDSSPRSATANEKSLIMLLKLLVKGDLKIATEDHLNSTLSTLGITQE